MCSATHCRCRDTTPAETAHSAARDRAAALALRRRGEEVIGVDASPDIDVSRLAEAGVELHLGTEEERLLDGVETLIKSPGVPGEALLVAAARVRGIPVWSELELGSQLLGNPIVGVTGTNGKTTTSELLGVMLGAPVAGNVGRALCDLDGTIEPGEVVVCEVSSFQLEDIHEFKPHVAVLLNLEPDHLDRHGSMDAYRAAKLRIFENQDEADAYGIELPPLKERFDRFDEGCEVIIGLLTQPPEE